MHLTRTTSALGVAPLLAALALTTDAWAHGGFPRAHQVLVDPGNPDRIVLRSDFWGIISTNDGGATWRLLCSSAYGGRPSEAERSPAAVAADGSIFVASSFNGLQTTGDDGCEWSVVPELTQADGRPDLVADVIASADGEVLHALSSTGDGTGLIIGQVWQSLDGGAAWATLGTLLPADVGGVSVASAPSQPGLLYVSGSRVGTGPAVEGVLVRSVDSGASWTELAVPLAEEQVRLRIAGVHPTDPATVFLWVDVAVGDDDAPDRLLVSTDSGETWMEAFAGAGDLPGFAFTSDGSMVAVAGPRDGVQRASTSEVVASGAAAFEPVVDGTAFGLAWPTDRLYAGLDDFTAPESFKVTLGSFDGANATFDPIVTMCDVVDSGCDPSSTTGEACAGVFEDLQVDFLADRCAVADSDGGIPALGADGGADDAPVGADGPSDDAANEGGCSCTSVTSRVASRQSGLGWLTLLLLAGRRARRRC